MRQLSLLLIICITATACVSEQEQREATYRYEQTMRNQCEHTLNFQPGTQGYMDCRMFYDKVLNAANLTGGTMSFSVVQNIQSRIKSTTKTCQTYWGTDGMPSSALWSCIREREQAFIDEAAHQKELQEQEEVLSRAFASGQKEANDDNRLQERIEAERLRVAQETGKNPKKVNCRTSTKANGYIQVKCK